jgi:hypothetical protein
MKCERCGKEIPEVVMVHRVEPLVVTLSRMAVTHHLFYSHECQRLKKAEDWKKEHPYG